VQEFLRRRYILAAAALLRHGATNVYRFLLLWSRAVDRPRGKTVRFSQMSNRGPTALSRRAFVANIDAATAHDVVPDCWCVATRGRR
jgi:hypothetical protein